MRLLHTRSATKFFHLYGRNCPSISPGPDGHDRIVLSLFGRMRRFRQYSYRNSFFGNRNHISRSGYPFQPITYLSRFRAGCIALQKYHYSLIPCHGQSTDTVFRSTRRVIDRSSAFCGVMALTSGSLSFRTGVRVPRASCYSIVKDQRGFYYPPHKREVGKGQNTPFGRKKFQKFQFFFENQLSGSGYL